MKFFSLMILCFFITACHFNAVVTDPIDSDHSDHNITTQTLGINFTLGQTIKEVENIIGQKLILSNISDKCTTATINGSMQLSFVENRLYFIDMYDEQVRVANNLAIGDSVTKLIEAYPNLVRSEETTIGGDESFNPITTSYSAQPDSDGNYVVFLIDDDNDIQDIHIYNIKNKGYLCEVY